MAASRAVGKKAFDFVKISDSLPPTLRAQLNGLRSQYVAVQTKLNSMPAEAPPIDWAKYSSSITAKGYVDEIKAAYEKASKIEYPKDNNGAAIAAAEKQALAEAAKLVEQAKAQVVALEAQLAKLAAEKPLDQITVDEFLATKPEMKKKIDDEIKAHNYI